jgi:hypothetical protein
MSARICVSMPSLSVTQPVSAKAIKETLIIDCRRCCPVKHSRLKRSKKVVRNTLAGLDYILHGIVLSFFRDVNKKIRSRIPVVRMEEETSAHLSAMMKVFTIIVVPASLFYIFVDLSFLGRNAIDSAMWGVLVFFYSNFLPDLPGIYWRKKVAKTKELQWYKKYALLLFAPLFVCFVVSGLKLDWKTAETFHNFKSVTVYGSFLVLLGLLFFGNLPMSVGRVTEILSISCYGILGYLTHLKVDEIW